jgi:hypothetical protein
MMFVKAKFSVECNILALVYVTRITSYNQVPLTMSNWRGMWIAVIILAQKVWDDIPLRTSSFVSILPGLRKEDLRKMEMEAFQLLDFNTTVKPSVYAKYYFELRELFHDICDGDSRFIWGLNPLSIVQAKRLDEKSNLKGELQPTTSGGKKSKLASTSSSAPSTPAVQTRTTPGSNYSGLLDQNYKQRGRCVLS